MVGEKLTARRRAAPSPAAMPAASGAIGSHGQTIQAAVASRSWRPPSSFRSTARDGDPSAEPFETQGQPGDDAMSAVAMSETIWSCPAIGWVMTLPRYGPIRRRRADSRSGGGVRPAASPARDAPISAKPRASAVPADPTGSAAPARRTHSTAAAASASAASRLKRRPPTGRAAGQQLRTDRAEHDDRQHDGRVGTDSAHDVERECHAQDARRQHARSGVSGQSPDR